jgi:hypothetical protein
MLLVLQRGKLHWPSCIAPGSNVCVTSWQVPLDESAASQCLSMLLLASLLLSALACLKLAWFARLGIARLTAAVFH